MELKEAVQLMREASSRIENPSINSNGKKQQLGGAYWRLQKVVNEFLEPRLEDCEGLTHAEFLRKNHEKENKPQEIELITIKEVGRITTFSTSHIHTMNREKGNTFPKPIKLGESKSSWIKSEISEWLLEKIKQRG